MPLPRDHLAQSIHGLSVGSGGSVAPCFEGSGSDSITGFLSAPAYDAHHCHGVLRQVSTPGLRAGARREDTARAWLTPNPEGTKKQQCLDRYVLGEGIEDTTRRKQCAPARGFTPTPVGTRESCDP